MCKYSILYVYFPIFMRCFIEFRTSILSPIRSMVYIDLLYRLPRVRCIVGLPLSLSDVREVVGWNGLITEFEFPIACIYVRTRRERLWETLVEKKWRGLEPRWLLEMELLLNTLGSVLTSHRKEMWFSLNHVSCMRLWIIRNWKKRIEMVLHVVDYLNL